MQAWPILYFDLGSPYAYLALERASRVLGVDPELEPILLGAIFQRRGSGSWATGPQRDERIADIERRAARIGLPEFVWPVGWPPNGLAAMRAATWAKAQDATAAFARTVARRQFAEGGDIADVEALAECAAIAGLDPDRMREAIASDEIKRRLRAATDAAWEAGVRGIPSLRVGDAVFFGDDQLETAARLTRPFRR